VVISGSRTKAGRSTADILRATSMDLAMANPIDGATPSETRSDGQQETSRSSHVFKPGIATGSLVEWFERISRLHAHRTAVVCGSTSITYAELNQAGDRIARRLRRMHLPQNAVVALYLDRSVEMLSAMLGVLKAGGAYLPLDATYPVARVIETLQDAQPAILITGQRLAAALPAADAQRLVLDAIPDTLQDLDEPMPEKDAYLPDVPLLVAPDDLAYVMYTSGSTGKPKGVLVTHRNVMRLLKQTQHWFEFNEHDVWTMFHSFAFDFSVWEVWGALLTGGKLVIVPFEVSRSPEDFYRLLSEQRVTVLNQTPSAFFLLNQAEETGHRLPLALRVVIFGGEALQYRALRGWFERHQASGPQLVNMYGITETTVHVTYRVVTERDTQLEGESLIGEPIPDLEIYLLDSHAVPVDEGEMGEICIGGAGVARGYLNRPELTAARFVPNPFGVAGSLLYRSGDLARRRPDGELVYLGRGDGQVKINGFRIELGEVEAVLREYPGVRQVCVIAHADPQGRQRLAAYLVMADDRRLATHSVSEFLSSRLPAQMMPAFYTQIDALPLTGNGKIDRAALPLPAAGTRGSNPEPGSPLQERVSALWRKVLDANDVSLDDNFFDIGGSSLLLIAIRTELQRQLERSIPVTWMFEFTTIRALAEKLQEGGSTAASAPVERVQGSMDAAQEQARRQREAFARIRAVKGGGR